MKKSPFDAIASSYDDTFTNTPVGQYQRSVVNAILARRFREGMRVLEIGCGTGVDTVFLAQRGVRVTASDASSGMVDIARRRVEEAGVQDLVDLRVCSAEQIADEIPSEPFDGISSNFGALNCLASPDTIGMLTANCLKPDACAALCLLGRWCLWEVVAHLGRLQMRTAFRRLHKNGADVSLGDETVHVIYPTPRRVIDICRPYCVPLKTTGVGVLIPPSYLNPLVDRFSHTFRLLKSVDNHINHLPMFNLLGDHYCLELQRLS